MHASRKSEDCGVVKGPALTDAEFREWFRKIVHSKFDIYRLLTPQEVIVGLAALEAYDGTIPLADHLRDYSLPFPASDAEPVHAH